MTLALYRKYRPQTFSEIIGQEHVTEPLSQALRSGRLHHAYLFSGPRGCGKTSSARILARSLNCEKGPTPDPCGQCDSCRALAPDGAGSIDVIEIDAASHGGVDDARELRERAFFAPVASRFKVYVIDEAHMVSPAGFNALLKLVEEPPEYVKFVFATTEPEKVLGTIKSRTHHYPFRLIPPGVLRPYLEQLCQREGVKVEPAVLPLVVRAGGGSGRDTLSVLDQLIAGAGPEGVTYARAVALLGVTDVALIDEMCDALAAGDGAAAYATIDRVAEAGHDPRRFASDLLERLRDLMILQQVPDAAAKGLLDCPQDVLERMSAQAAHLGAATLSRFADIVHNGLTEMRGTTAPRLLLELICARMLLPGADDSAGALLQRLERMERRLELGAASAGSHPPPAAVAAAPVQPAAPVRPQPPTSPPPSAATPSAAPPSGVATPHAVPDRAPAVGAGPSHLAAPSAVAEQAVASDAAIAAEPAVAAAEPTPAPEATPSTPGSPGALDAVAVRRVWDEVLTMVGRKSKRAAAVVREATVRDVDGNVLVLVFQHSVHADMLSGSPDLLVEALYELLGGRWQLRCEVGGGTAGPSASRPGAAPPRREPAPRPDPATAAPDPAPRSDQAAGGSRSAPAAPINQPATRAAPPQPSRPSAAGQTASAVRQTVPTTARPAGPTAAGPPEPATEDWPTPAVPGGGTAVAAAGPARPTSAGPVRPASQPTPQSTPRSAPQPTPQSSAQATAQAVARQAQPGTRTSAPAGRAAPVPRGVRPGGDRQPGGNPRSGVDSTWEGTADEEPPYDPEYDPAVPGFDPGDEPVDDAEGGTVVRESSEEQALRLLTEALGAERIGGTDQR